MPAQMPTFDGSLARNGMFLEIKQKIITVNYNKAYDIVTINKYL